MKKRGRRPIDVDAYYKGAALRYSGIWIKNTENYKWASFRNLTDAQFKARFNEYRKKGYMPIDVEGYVVGGKLRYAVIWVENRDRIQWAEHRNMSASGYGKKWTEYKAKSFRPIDFESYKKGRTQYYAAIWVKNTNRCRCASYRDMTKLGYANRWRTLRDKGYRLIDFERYNTSKGYRYAGIWRQNGERANWPHRATVDRKVYDYWKINNLPGISVVVAEGGMIVYRRGFGDADVKKGRVAHGQTVYSAASVCKAIGATLYMRMKEKNPDGLNMTKKTRSYIPEMPRRHTHTVKQLLSHRGCVRHYKNVSPRSSIPSVQYNTALSASKKFWKDKLVCTPGAAGKYSTHAYSFVGAVLEKAGNQSIGQLLRSRLAAPLGLGSLRAEFPLSSNYDRAQVYRLRDKDKAPHPETNKNKKFSRDNNSWKVLGGGCELHAVDLARLGIKLKKGRVMRNATRREMWTKTGKVNNRDYGLSWFLTNSYVEHGGSWTGARSLIRIYKNKDLVIAIMSNRRNHKSGNKVWNLANAIANAL